MKAIIKEKREVADQTLQVTFQTEEDITFQPGQYMDVVLINPPYDDAKGPKRHFSIVNSPNEKRTLMLTTRLRDSAFKKSLKELPIGTEVDIHHIGGTFVLPQETKKPIVWIAGGIGITPFMSMIKFIQEENLSYNITLIYSNRNSQSSVFLEELQKIAEINPNFKLILTMTDDPNWNQEKRKIDGQFIKDYVSDPNNVTYMVVGPPGMVEAVVSVLKDIGVGKDNIMFENFTGY